MVVAPPSLALDGGTLPVTTPTVGGPSTCLTKTYLADGSVEFRKEAAIATPGG
jgi:hypothetical protein